MITKTPLILVGNRLGGDSARLRAPPSDAEPRRDYREIASRLDGNLLGYDAIDARWYRRLRWLETLTKFDFVEAVMAFNRRSQSNVIFSTSEKMALPLSMLSTLSDSGIRHVAVAHRLSSSFKSHLFRAWPLYRSFSRVITLCRAQAEYAVLTLDLPPSKVAFIYHHVDQNFFRPVRCNEKAYILAVGREQRDYTTLLQALSGTGLQLVIVSSSPWSSSGRHNDMPQNVTTMSNIPYRELRALYAAARIVVLPLHDVDYAAGTTTLLEAMAMGKAVITSRSRGISDYVVDGQTGLFVQPEDPDELREHIQSLWGQPRRRTDLGVNARQAVEEQMNLDCYVDQVAAIVEEVGRIHRPSFQKPDR